MLNRFVHERMQVLLRDAVDGDRVVVALCAALFFLDVFLAAGFLWSISFIVCRVCILLWYVVLLFVDVGLLLCVDARFLGLPCGVDVRHECVNLFLFCWSELCKSWLSSVSRLFLHEVSYEREGCVIIDLHRRHVFWRGFSGIVRVRKVFGAGHVGGAASHVIAGR